jgi:hypothetical protein
MSGLEAMVLPIFFAPREPGFGPSLHSPQCSNPSAIEALSVKTIDQSKKYK